MQGNMQLSLVVVAIWAFSFVAAACTNTHTVFTTITGGT